MKKYSIERLVVMFPKGVINYNSFLFPIILKHLSFSNFTKIILRLLIKTAKF